MPDDDRLAQARKLIIRLGRVRFGRPEAAILSALDRITDPKELKRLGDNLMEVSSWEELLGQD